MHLASWSLAVLFAVGALLLTHSTEAAKKVEKSTESQASSLEDELESSLRPQPQQQQQQPQQQPPQQQQQPPQQQETLTGKATKQPTEHKLTEHQRDSAPPTQKAGRRPNREELRAMFRELLESMTDAERESLTLRLGSDSVKRTFRHLKDEVRSRPRASAVSKRAMPPRSKALRMRRSLLRGSMEAGMAADRQRRKKRDLVDYSPEEYAELARLLAGGPGYVEDGDGDIRLEGDGGGVGGADGGAINDWADQNEAGEAEKGEGDVEKKRLSPPPRLDEELDDEPEERAPLGNVNIGGYGVGDRLDDDEDEHGGEEGDYDDDGGGELGQAALPPPPPPPMAALEAPQQQQQQRQPLTMFLVRLAGEKGLFVPLDQQHAELLAGELEGEAAIAEAAEAQVAEEAATEAAVGRLRQAEGVAELKRFAEKLARRIPPGY